MYLAARDWGIQPSEFWDMTVGEWLLEADAKYRASPRGQRSKKIRGWLADAELTDEEWNAKYGNNVSKS